MQAQVKSIGMIQSLSLLRCIKEELVLHSLLYREAYLTELTMRTLPMLLLVCLHAVSGLGLLSKLKLAGLLKAKASAPETEPECEVVWQEVGWRC